MRYNEAELNDKHGNPLLRAFFSTVPKGKENTVNIIISNANCPP